MYYFSIMTLILLLVLFFVTAWRVDKVIEEYSSAIVTQARKLGLNLEIPNQMPLDHRQKVKIIREAKQIQTIKNMAHIRVLETRYQRVSWVLGILFVVSLPIVIIFKSGDFF